jgi:hypothetical protein
MRRTAVILLILVGMIMAGCASSGSSAAEPVEAYLQAIVDQDADRISTLVCSDWADSALLEMDAFMGVQAELDNVSCSEVEVLKEFASVTCSGSILATYNNEQQQFSLEGRQYQLIKEGSEWLVCGYQ